VSLDERLLGKIDGTLESILRELKRVGATLEAQETRLVTIEKQQALIRGVGLALLGLASVIGALAVFWS
jgi:hypothetical protein